MEALVGEDERAIEECVCFSEMKRKKQKCRRMAGYERVRQIEMSGGEWCGRWGTCGPKKIQPNLKKKN